MSEESSKSTNRWGWAERLTLVLAVLLGIMLGWQAAQTSWIQQLVSGSSNKNSQNTDLKIFWEAWRKLDSSYYQPEDISEDQLVEGATMGMVASLGDPYTMYLPPADNDRSGEDLAGAFYGIGVELTYVDGLVGVQAPLPNTPAEKAGLQARDIFIHVKDELNGVDEDTYDWTTSKAQSILRAKEKTPVTLTVFREDYNNNEPFEVELVRDEIKVDSITLDYLPQANGQEVAHLRVSTFGERTYEEWETAVKDILAHPKVSGVVLDLRNNPGGLFNEALHIASEFIKDGVIVRQEGRKSSTTKAYQATGRARLDKMPVVVLVNGGSASSSEIVAGALRDQRGAKMVGQQTFGKGLVQERLELSNGGGLHVTIATWKLPNGDWIQDNGIAVDVEVIDDRQTPDIDEALVAAVEALNQN